MWQNYGLLIITLEFKNVMQHVWQFFYFTTESFLVTSRLSLQLIPFIGNLEQFYLNNDLLLVKLLVCSLFKKKYIRETICLQGSLGNLQI